MEPLSLTCTTCKSRLKVRDPGAVGQILACPKCGGMVLVKALEPGAPAASSDAGDTRSELSNSLRPAQPLSGPLHSDAFDAVDELLGNVPARTMVPTPTVRPAAGQPAVHARMEPPIGTPPTIIQPSDRGRQSPDSQAKTVSQDDMKVAKAAPAVKKPEPVSRAAAAAVVSAAVTAPVMAAAPVAKPAPSVTPQPGVVEPAVGAPLTIDPSSAASTWPFWAIVGGSGLLGVVLAISVVVISISWFSKPPVPVMPPVAQAPVAPETNVPAEQAHAANPNGNSNGNSNDLVKPPVAPEPNAVASVEPKQPEAGPPKPVEPMPKPMPMAPLNPAPPIPMPPERDPLGITDPVPPARPSKPAEDPLKQFDNILGGGNENPLPMPAPAEPKSVLPPPEEDPGVSPTAPTLPKPQARHIDVAARLADPLPAIEITGSPLADFLQVMQDFSTVPITLRPDGLSMVKLTPFDAETPVTWKGKSTNALEAIQASLTPLGLEARIEADQLVVDVASPQITTMRMGVKDLTNSDERLAGDLATLLTALVAPETWQDDEAGPSIVPSNDELQVKQHRQALAECVLIIEKLRVARGLRPQSRFDAKLFDLTTRSQKAAAALATPITLNYSQPTPLLRVLERVGKTASVRILVDWQALSVAGWNPEGEVTLTVDKQPLAKTLDDLTRRMELTWRVVDARTLQLTTPAALADRTEFEIYPLGDRVKDEAAGDALVAKLRTALGNEHFRDVGGKGELRFDLAGKCLLATLPQPQQVQLAALLAKL